MSEIRRLAEHYRDKGDERANYLYKSLIADAEKTIARSPHDEAHPRVMQVKLELSGLLADLAVSKSRAVHGGNIHKSRLETQQKDKEVVKLLKKSLHVADDLPKHILQKKDNARLKRRKDKMEATVLGNLGTVHYGQGTLFCRVF